MDAVTNPYLGKSYGVDGYKVKFFNKEGEVVAKVSRAGQQVIKEIVLKMPSDQFQDYEDLSLLDRFHIHASILYAALKDQLPEDFEEIVKKFQSAGKKKLASPNTLDDLSDSDEEITEVLVKADLEREALKIKKQATFDAGCTTVFCRDRNIKGGELIKIVHGAVKKWYDALVEKVEDKKLTLPELKDGVLSVRTSVDYFLSLGGWKGMIPKEEVIECLLKEIVKSKSLFGHPTSETRPAKLKGAEICGNGIPYKIEGNRIYLPADFFKSNPSAKTDLSYAQIVNIIVEAEKQFGLTHSEIAALQLQVLKDKRDEVLSELKKKKIATQAQEKFLVFLNYFNALMFGVEATGLNAGLVTGLMMLQLIVCKRYDYQTAFKGDDGDGIYPFACSGGNQGTYQERERVLKSKEVDLFSISNWRREPSLCPVGVKEALLIKEWLRVKKVISGLHAYANQKHEIAVAVSYLMQEYYPL